ncbi:MAG: hypothetical protein ABIG20_04565 [archaeon]
MKIEEKRKTSESEIKVVLEDGQRRDMKIDTGLNFLNHQVKQIAWRLCMNIDASIKNTTEYRSTHTMSEDLGIVLGRALLKMYEQKAKEGVNGFGAAYGVIDEARAFAAVSIEGRANSFVEMCPEIERLELVEDMLCWDLVAFLEGLAQGMKATVQVNIERGRDPHHSWEATYRALGEALKIALQKNEWRKGTIAGVKGTLE